MKAFFVIPFILILLSLHGCKMKPEIKSTGIHFVSQDMQLRAPKELFLHNGEYHLFYQAKENDQLIHCKHAISKDLFNWNQTSKANKLDSLGSIGVWSVVVDLNNQSGLATDNSPFIGFYTNASSIAELNNRNYKSINLAISIDDGNSWLKKPEYEVQLYNTNSDIRDVKVIWHEEMQRWVMLVLSGYQVQFYFSEDLLNWEYFNEFGNEVDEKKGEWTDLEFFQIGVDNSNNKFWVLFVSTTEGSPNNGSGTQYFVGEFNGFEFAPITHKPKWVDNGSDNFAGVGVTNYYEPGEPSYYLGWINNSKYGNSINNDGMPELYTLPRKLTLINKFNDYFLKSVPVEFIETQDNTKLLVQPQNVNSQVALGKHLELPITLKLTFDVNNRTYLDLAEVFGIEIINHQNEKTIIGYNSVRRYFFIRKEDENNVSEEYTDIDYAFYAIDKSTLDLKIIIDHSSVEIFAIDGFISMTKKCALPDGIKYLNLFAENGHVKLLNGNQTGL